MLRHRLLRLVPLLLCWLAALPAAPAAMAQDLAVVAMTPEQRAWYRQRLDAHERGIFEPTPAELTQAVSLARHPQAERLVQWDRLRRPASVTTFEELAAFLAANPGWPQRRTLQVRAEQALSGSTVPALTRLAYFSRNPPVTAPGRVRYAAALRDQGRSAEATVQARDAWRQGATASADESFILTQFPGALKPEDHQARLELLLWSGQTSAARRMIGFLDPTAQAVAEARMALRARASDVPMRLAAVPEAQRGHAGLAFDLARYRRLAQSDETGAADALLAADPTAAAIAEPAAWLGERLRAGRAVMTSDPGRAYRLLAGHGLAGDPAALEEEGADDRAAFVEIEWLAGWVALRKLGRPAEALGHFSRITHVARTPISLSRAGYWAGRAAEAMGQAPLARQWYHRAAEHSDHFYGQLALEQLGYAVPPVMLDRPAITPAQRQAFMARDVVQATALLGALEARTLQSQFLRHLADEARTAQEKTFLADYAYAIRRLDLAVMIGKLAGTRGLDLAFAAYPKLDVASIAEDDWVMVHAIARQESLFNTQAVSRAGARGLMQLMPATAAEMARALGLDYAVNRLVDDPEYNLQLGSGYYRKMLGRWSGSHLLAVASYNAGPGSVNRWLNSFGDPRSPTVDLIDWIEQIPFRETRNYVHRVLENAVVYRSIRKGDDRQAQWHGLSHFLRRPATQAVPASPS